MKTCAECGKEFDEATRHAKSRFCCYTHADQWWRKKLATELRDCKQCEARFVPTNYMQRYCPDCKKSKGSKGSKGKQE